MPDRDLTPEEYEFVICTLDTLAVLGLWRIAETGPTAEEDRLYCSLLDMGFTEQWIAEQLDGWLYRPGW